MSTKNPNCPKCGSDKVKKDGLSNPYSPQYCAPRFRCTITECRHGWSVPPPSVELKPLHKLRSQDRMAIMYHLLRWPWSAIKVQCAGVKQQTVKRKLKRIFEKELFPTLKDSLLNEFPNLDESDFVELQKELEADAQKKPVFRSAGQKIGREWREGA